MSGGEPLIVYGLNPVLALLKAERRPVHRLWLAEGRRTDRRLAELLELAASRRIPVGRHPGRKLDMLAGGTKHQGVVAETVEPIAVSLEDLSRGEAGPPLVVVLDGVEDPRNLGAILRTAGAVGADGVVLPRRHRAPLGTVAAKVAEGAAEYVPVVTVVNLTRALGELKRAGLWLVGLDATASKLWHEVDLTGPTALVLGSEGAGLRRLVRESCDFLVSMPVRAELGSVNVSVAAAVALYEALRQRMHAQRVPRLETSERCW